MTSAVPHLHKGQRVRFAQHGYGRSERGEGVISLIWQGMELTVDVEVQRYIWTETVALYPGMGDEIEVLP